jgi:hypothetical protein
MTDHGTIAETGEISPMNRSQEEPAFAALLERHRRELHRSDGELFSLRRTP